MVNLLGIGEFSVERLADCRCALTEQAMIALDLRNGNRISPHPKRTMNSTAARRLRLPQDGTRRNTSHALAHTPPLP